MHLISFDASSRQLGKLKKGLPVRIKKGTGFNVIVHPETYHLVSRAFAKNKGIEIALSPEELEANRSLSPEQHAELRKSQPELAGEGIFGKKFDYLVLTFLIFYLIRNHTYTFGTTNTRFFHFYFYISFRLNFWC